ncbi:metal ABC transporter ATP-binding protein [Rhizobiales bacterium]|uniref:metal ABC transporter ATP-binding protein n=1 Tax=Hongsoonwoonella zoysiae TaxID=2821844 RepID=UPI001560B97A|nr:metal ABC transporter ATP-binding protein [Hongsoonwoonella zoysiae]NRG19671.1 metal ABC transporter ATP-binding protein [Hongsoonwoonella zoysiae]
MDQAANTGGRGLKEAGQSATLDPKSPFSVSGLTVAYDRKPVLWNASFTAPEGELTAIVGPNGAGKSTFLKGSLGLIPKLSGEVGVFGRPIDEARRDIAYVPQRSSVDWDFPATALDVVTMGLYRRIGWLRWPGRRDKERAHEMLALVGMEAFADRQIGQLSGGQQQRVFLARALAQDARVYLMDEPFAGVDAATERAIVDVLKKLLSEGKTVLVVHHDLETVPVYFSHVLFLNGGTVAAGPVADAFTAENLQKTYGGRLAATQLAALDEAAAMKG